MYPMCQILIFTERTFTCNTESVASFFFPWERVSGVGRVRAARAALEFDAPEAHKNTYCTMTGS